jgi:hypothetical protein
MRQGDIFDDYEPATKRARLWMAADKEIIGSGYTPGPMPVADRAGVAQPVGYAWNRNHGGGSDGGSVLAVLKPNRIIRKRTDVNCSNFQLRVFIGLSNPHG